MLITQNINLDFGRDTMPPSVFVKQHDSDTRKLVITPLNNGEAYTIGNGITARFHMTKPDGTTVIDDATISSGKIEFTLTAQCLAAAGIGVAEIGLYKGTQLLTTQTFYIEIKAGAYTESAVESSDEYNSLIEALEHAVPKTRKIAGVDLQDDITAAELKTALSVMEKIYAANDAASISSVPTGQLFTAQGRLCRKTSASTYIEIAALSDIPTVPTNMSDLTNDVGYIPTYTGESAPPSTQTADFYPAPCIWMYDDRFWLVYSRSEITVPGSPTQYYYGVIELVESGALPTKTSDLTNDSGFVAKYDTLAALCADTKLAVGAVVQTKGYHTANDGGGASYKIVSSSNTFTTALSNGLYAEPYFVGGCKSARQFGAYGDGSHDDTAALQKWLDHVALYGGYAYLPTGQYKITAPLNLTWTNSGDYSRNGLQKIVGDGCTSYNSTDNSCIIAYNIPADHAALELISNAGNSWGTQAELSDFGIYCDTSCDPMSFCLMYGDSRQFMMRKMKLKGYNDILCRCGSTPPSGTNSYEHVNVTIENCDLLVRSNATNGTKGFAFLPESVGYSRGYSMLDNLYLNNCMIGGLFVVHVNNLVVDNCMVAIEGIKYKAKTTSNPGRLNGVEVDYATGLLIVETASSIIRNLYCEDFRRAVDIIPAAGNIRSVLIEGSYFNPGTNQTDSQNAQIMSDYGVYIRPVTGKSVYHVEIAHNIFRHDGNIAFNVASIQNDAAQQIIVNNNCGRPAGTVDQIVNNAGSVVSIDSIFTNSEKTKLANCLTAVSSSIITDVSQKNLVITNGGTTTTYKVLVVN